MTIDFLVRVPKDTPADAVLYISGNLPGLGTWDAAALPLARRADGRYEGKASLPRGSAVEYKITRGTWETVERGLRGEDIANRHFSADKDATVEIEIAAWAAPTPPKPRSQRTGDIRFHEHFASKELGNQRTLAVWLPPDYAKKPDTRYPVLYLHDGQNVFDAATSFIGVEWQADETADRLIRAGRIPPILIVAVYNNADRMNEYTPTRDAGRKTGGKGEAYARFLIREVKPFIDRTYRTLPDRGHTAVAGSSLGGLISLHIAARHSDTFGKCAALSPSLMWDDARLLRQIEADPAWTQRVRLWFDMGTREGRQIPGYESADQWTRRLAAALDKSGRRRGVDYRYLEVEGAEHNETAWAARFDQVLLFLFGKP